MWRVGAVIVTNILVLRVRLTPEARVSACAYSVCHSNVAGGFGPSAV